MNKKKKLPEGLEITTFKLRACSFKEFIAANADIDAFLQRQPGFISRHMAQQPGGMVMDLLVWESAEEGTAAMHRLMDEMAHSAVHGMIEQGTVSWNIYPVGHVISRGG